MHCNNLDMQSHCIGKSFGPYNSYQSLSFLKAMYNQFDDSDSTGQYRV
ncbi:hypothetical protein C444_08170 [Haloarcula japonica DSM 6131]|uniref:Primase-associated C-terminal domain-containing protein n=2 Tax=Haloarcula TaxID=2237 RepID=A0A830F250_9EURY|nr:hypothetical protein C444_08170 [Haloarcula japonica DSM 6131]GGK78792.1 hypothetical protein GCM10009067_33890 [Haloarcula sebkhae]